jgi:hypothetical protein
MGTSTSQVALGDTTIATSPAMGDATRGTSLQAVVLDSYNRAFSVNLGASMRQAMVQPRLLGALDTNRTATTLGTDACRWPSPSTGSTCPPASRALPARCA